MILTVTLNASIDRLYLLNGFDTGAVNRVREARCTAGGKGLNVARVAQLCGAEVQALGFAGGHTGRLLCDLLRADGVTPGFTMVEAETRCCINVRDEATSMHTELLEPGAPVTEEDTAHFLAGFAKALPGSGALTLSGSLPGGLGQGFYAELVELANQAGVPVLLDTSGEALHKAVAAKPTLVKPNSDEIEQLLGRRPQNRRECAAAARALHDTGIAYAVVSLGAGGSIMACGEGVFWGKTPSIPVVNTVGCGDSMLAAFAVGIEKGMKAEELLRFATAVSTANALCLRTGWFEQSVLEGLLGQCTTEQLE